MEDVGYVFGTLSIVFYSICYFPQFYKIFRAKSSQGVSVTSILLWTQADVLSLIASVLLDLSVTLVAINWYNVLLGIGMAIVIVYYNPKHVYTSGLCIIVNVVVCIAVCIVWPEAYEPGIVLGYITTFVYIIGRFPQIAENQVAKSTGEVSLAMYVCTLFGNVCYLVVCFVYPEAIFENLPWIISTFACSFLDLVVMYQMYIYRPRCVDSQEC